MIVVTIPWCPMILMGENPSPPLADALYPEYVPQSGMPDLLRPTSCLRHGTSHDPL